MENDAKMCHQGQKRDNNILQTAEDVEGQTTPCKASKMRLKYTYYSVIGSLVFDLARNSGARVGLFHIFPFSAFLYFIILSAP